MLRAESRRAGRSGLAGPLLFANHTYLADSDGTTVAEAAKAWLDHCEVCCKTGRRMERSTLRRWKLRCPKNALDLVFPAPRGGILQHTKTQARFRKLQEKVEVTMRWRDLRHFAVDRAGLLDQGNHDLRGPFLNPDDHGKLRPPVPVTRSPEGNGNGRGKAGGVTTD